MKVALISIPVLDQDKALKFYTEKLGFITKHDVPIENNNRWLTLVSPAWPDGTEILLEPSPNNFEPSRVYQEALMEAGIPYTQFDVENVDAEYESLTKLGVDFSVEPTDAGNVRIAIFNDTCGNNIQMIEYLEG
tara:strand:+ start:4436 stop:4837 length:402 start_codon:yes stop_codon:yes gene_type:complete